MTSQYNYPDGIDCAWLGFDRHGAIAAFVTAGNGEIPTTLLSDFAVDPREIETLLMNLPVTGDFNMLVSIPRPDDFQDMASRGLYVYDWDGAKYILVAEPGNSITLSKINSELGSAIDLVSFESIDFSSQPTISVGSMMEVSHPAM